MNGVNPLVHPNPGINPYTAGGLGGDGSLLNPNGGVSIDSVASVALLFLQSANQKMGSAMDEAQKNQQQTPQAGGQGDQGGAPDNISMAKLSQAQQNLNAVNTMVDSLIQAAGQNAKEGAKL